MKFLALLLFLLGCQPQQDPQKEIWIYTSMYKDTVADMTTELAKVFPEVTIHWYQAGSEEIAARANGEIMAGGIRADLLISSDRFWYEELARGGLLVSHKGSEWEKIPASLKQAEGFYTAVSIPVMVLTYNKEAIKELPKTYKEMSEEKWKGKFTTGSPLASGTNFTTMAMLKSHYGWEYFKKLKDNQTIVQGGNSAVIRRVQTLERPVGWVLLEDLLRLQGKDDRLGIIYPEDGVVTHANVMGITKRPLDRTLAKKIANWMLSDAGQKAMLRSYMYSPIPNYPAPKGAPELTSIKAFQWTPEFIKEVTDNRIEIKDEYSEIMFQ
ncbi:MAG: extracellular solute-binding protein [Bacteriovoracaceae bacterium]|nr:extracellular solute-binding protein [Bacteriovoracaceae bacterium]